MAVAVLHCGTASRCSAGEVALLGSICVVFVCGTAAVKLRPLLAVRRVSLALHGEHAQTNFPASHYAAEDVSAFRYGQCRARPSPPTHAGWPALRLRLRLP